MSSPLGGSKRGLDWEISPCQPLGDEKAHSAHQPFLLSAGLALIPPRLVAKIQKLEFVDMAELLRDNLEVQRRAASQGQLLRQVATDGGISQIYSAGSRVLGCTQQC